MSEQSDNLQSQLAAAIKDHQSGRLDDAATGYANILAQAPEHADALHLSGLIAFQRGNLLDAKNLIEKAIERDPTQYLYHANLGRVEMASLNFQEATNAWHKALALDAQSADIHSDISGALLKQNKAAEAMEYADKALSLKPGHPMAVMNKGLVHSFLNQTEQAIELLEVTAKNFPDDAEIWFQLGYLYQQSVQMKPAEHAYKTATTLSATHSMAFNNLGNLFRDQGRFDEALKAYDRSLGVDADQSDVYSNRGVAYQEMGDSAVAIASYRQAVRLNPENAEARRNLGMGLLLTGNYEEGWAEYEWRWKTEHFKPVVRNWSQPR